MNLHINSSRTDPSLDYSISKLEKNWLYGNAAMLSLRLGSVSANMAAGAICAQKQETGKKGSNLSIWLGHLHTRTHTHTCNPARRNEWFDADRWRARRHLKQPNKNGRRFLLLFWGCPFPPRPSGQIEPVDDLYFPAHAHADTHTHTHRCVYWSHPSVDSPSRHRCCLVPPADGKCPQWIHLHFARWFTLHDLLLFSLFVLNLI